jgi:hypothetical protein
MSYEALQDASLRTKNQFAFRAAEITEEEMSDWADWVDKLDEFDFDKSRADGWYKIIREDDGTSVHDQNL